MTYQIVEKLRTKGATYQCSASRRPTGELMIESAAHIEALARVLVKALEFVEEMEARNDTHYLIGGEIYTALSNLREGQG